MQKNLLPADGPPEVGAEGILGDQIDRPADLAAQAPLEGRETQEAKGPAKAHEDIQIAAPAQGPLPCRAEQADAHRAGFPELLHDEFEGGLTAHNGNFGLFFGLGKTGRGFS